MGPHDGALLCVLRHGRTRLNRDGALRGRLDVPLDEVGEAEAHRLAELFAVSGLALVVTSPLARAVATAAAVAARRGIEPVLDEALLDRDYGEWSGEPEHEVVARFGSLDAAPGVEPWATLAGRVVGAADAAVAQAAGQPVALVAHDAVNRALLTELVPRLRPPTSLPQPTGCWSELRYRSGGWVATVVGAIPGDGCRPTRDP